MFGSKAGGSERASQRQQDRLRGRTLVSCWPRLCAQQLHEGHDAIYASSGAVIRLSMRSAHVIEGLPSVTGAAAAGKGRR